MSTFLAQRSKPAYDNLEIRALSEQLEDARAREQKLRGAGIQTDEVRREILELRRKMRDRGQLRAGADLGDGRYLLIQQVGRGGFAVVWEAHDRKEDRRVAIKVLHNHLAGDQQRRERFFRGARVMLQFEHPAVVRVLDSRGEDEHFYYFVMELLHGGNLRDAILEKRVEPSRVLPLILQVGEALAEAHRRGLIHRDIKPANILLDEVGNAKLTDFDLVGAHDTTGGTRTGALGTVVYAAPECLDKPQLATPRADVFSLGMTAIFCLSGRELSMSTFRDPTVALMHLDCAPGVRQVLARASAWEPGNRYLDAVALVGALRGALSEAEATGELLMLSPKKASKVVAEIRAILGRLRADSEVAESIPKSPLDEDLDVLSHEELRDAWPLLGIEERSDGLRVLRREDAEDFFIALSAADQVALLLHFRPGQRRQWIRLLEPDDIVAVLLEASDEHRSPLFHLLNAPTRKEVITLLASVEADAIAAAADRSAELTPQPHQTPLDIGHSSSTRAEVAMGASRSHATASASEEGDGAHVPGTLALGRGELAPQPTSARKRSVVVGVVSAAAVAASLVVAVMVTRTSEPKLLLGERAHGLAAVSPETAITTPPGAAPIDLRNVAPPNTCGTADETQTLTLQCPLGLVMREVVFADYGLPLGACGSFSVNPSCHAPAAADVVRSLCAGKSTCAIAANTEQFGDPCAGVRKHLSAAVTCGE